MADDRKKKRKKEPTKNDATQEETKKEETKKRQTRKKEPTKKTTKSETKKPDRPKREDAPENGTRKPPEEVKDEDPKKDDRHSREGKTPPFREGSQVRWTPNNPGGADKPSRSRTMDIKGFDADLPILLLPVRLETRFILEPEPGELRIRILPDTVSVDGSAPASAGEMEVARTFWARYLETEKPRVREAAWRQYVRRLGPERAGYVARLVQPSVRGGTLVFPDVDPGPDGPAIARLLPARWMAMGWVGDDLAFRAYSAPLKHPLVLSPDPNEPPRPAGDTGLKIDRQVDWMFDYPKAVKRGMAITVPFVGDAAVAAQGVSTLLVLGLDSEQSPEDAAEELGSLFAAHAKSAGMAFVPQGTPTNNTRTVASGYRREERELADMAEKELGVGDSAQARVDPHENAVRLARGLGLESGQALRRAPFGDDPEFVRSRDMRVALFESVLGTYVRQLLSTYPRAGGARVDALSKSQIRSLRAWFNDWVTGGAPLPSFRIGRQPYGVLPVMRTALENPGSDVAGQVAAVVDALLGEWRAAVLGVPTLDHNAADDANDRAAAAEAREAVTAVLANNPHPRILSVRGAKDWSDQAPFGHIPATARLRTGDTVDRNREIGGLGGLGEVDVGGIVIELEGGFRYEYDTAIDQLNDRYAFTLKPLYDQVLQQVVPPRLGREIIQPLPTARVVVGGSPRTDADIRNVEEQLEIWVQLDASINDGFAIWIEVAEFFPEFHDFCQDVIDQIARHELRQRPLRWLGLPGFEGVLGRDNNQLLLTRFDGSDRRWTRPIAAPAESSGEATARDYLLDVRDRLAKSIQPPGMGSDFLESSPLLYQLLDATRGQGDGTRERKQALRRLAEVDPVDLEWLTRETLGLGIHRLDAWHTSLASERLARMRERRERGLYAGAYGLVLDLVPTGRKASNGFIHAPSLAQAASAAVLRSGWLARGAPDASAPAAIDLRSDRVRGADWLMSGVRQGQELGSLLGYEFERALHDRNLDVAIRPLRLAAAEDPGQESAGNEPVDGIALLDLHRAGALSATIVDLALSATDQSRLEGLLDGLAAAFDSVDDAATFESVHQLVVGNLERASAVIDAFGPAGGPPPELLGIRTARSAATVDNRVLVTIDASATDPKDGWSVGTRDRIDPALDAWVAAMLPSPDRVGWVAVLDDGSEQDVVLASLALSALDTLYLASDDPTRATPALHRLTEQALGSVTVRDVQASNSAGAPVSLAELQILALELRRLIDESAAAGPAALWSPEKVEDAVVDAQPVVTRADGVLSEVEQAMADARPFDTWAELPAAIAASLARAGLAVDDTADPDAMSRLLARATRRHDAASAVDEADALDAARARVACLLGAAASLLPDFAYEADDQAVTFDEDLAPPDEVDEWLDALGAVRPRVGLLSRTLLLGDLAGSPAADLKAGQAPALPDDRWAALHRPAPGTGGRTVVAALGFGTVEPGSSLVGLVVDQWADRLPLQDQVTGVSFQFDGPSTQPPQSLLLAVPPDGEPWSLDLLVDTVLETVEWAMLRSVAFDDLGDYGHALPTTMVPGDLEPSMPTGGAT